MKAAWKTSPVGRTLLAIGSIYLGVGLLAALTVYLSLASTVPVWLARTLGVELFSPGESVQTELYDNPGFVGACIALCVNLLVATVVRIPLRLRNAGAWCCHLGLIVLAGASLWYNHQTIKGDSVTIRDRTGWSPIRHVYRGQTYAVYVQAADDPQARQTPLKGLIPRGAPRDLDVAIQAGKGVEVRATRFLPGARVVARWGDVSPNRVPAVQLRVIDGDEAGTIVLSPSLPQHRQLGGRGYVFVYHAGLTPEALARVISPGDPNQGPGMPHDLALILTGSKIPPTLAVVRPNGSRWHGRLEVGQTLDVPLAGRTIRVEPVRFLAHAARLYELEGDDGGDHAHAHEPPGAAVRLELAVGPWKRTTYVRFAAYQHLAPPQLIDLPGNRGLWVTFSRERVALPATLQVARAEYQTYPASGIPKDYRCDVEIVSGGMRRRETLSLNNPVHVGAFQVSQGSWARDPHRPTRIFLSAATRPGLWAIWTGCVLICLGLPVAFYVKPLLARRRSAP